MFKYIIHTKKEGESEECRGIKYEPYLIRAGRIVAAFFCFRGKRVKIILDVRVR